MEATGTAIWRYRPGTMRMTLIPILLLAACSGTSRTAAPPSPPSPVESPLAVADCMRLLGPGLGISGEAPYEGRAIEGDPDSVVPIIESAGAEVIRLRDSQGSSICIVWKQRDTKCPEDASDECLEENESGEWQAQHVIAAVAGDGSRVTDKLELESNNAELSTEGQASWKMVAIGPDADALLLERSDDSGDSTATETRWLTLAGGKLIELFQYRVGTDDLGRMASEVEHQVTENVTAAHFDIRFRVRALDEDADEEASMDDVPFREETCSWETGAGRYRCPDELLDRP